MLVTLCGLGLVLVTACDDDPHGSDATPALTATATSTPAATQVTVRASATPRLTETPAPTPAPPAELPFEATTALVVISATSHVEPSAASPVVQSLSARSAVHLAGAVSGENWVIGDQGWVPIEQDWGRTWYRLEDGSYVYRAFIFLPQDGPAPSASPAGERYVVVDLGQQRAWAMEGETAVRSMAVTTGKDGFTTPTGQYSVFDWGRLETTSMSSVRAGIVDEAEQYDVQNVLYTQYFAEGGFALHMNYWQPPGVYGSTATSHGCVGLPLADAQYLWLFGSAGMRVIIRQSGGATPVPPKPAAARIPTATPSPAATATPPSPTPTATPAATPAPPITPTVTPTPAP